MLALSQCPGVRHVIVVKRTGGTVDMDPGRDIWYHEAAAKVTARLCACGNECGRSAVHPLHLGLDRKAQRRAAYHRRLSALRRVDASISCSTITTARSIWCTADVGWVTGHSYIVYGPLANGATTLMFEGVPNYPDRIAVLGGDRQAQGQYLLHRAHRHPRLDARRRRAGEENLARLAAPSRQRRRADQSGSWLWYYRVVGDGRCPIVDTWWQTETGGI